MQANPDDKKPALAGDVFLSTVASAPCGRCIRSLFSNPVSCICTRTFITTSLTLLLVLALAACAAPAAVPAPPTLPSHTPAPAANPTLQPSPTVTLAPARTATRKPTAIPFDARSLRELAEAHNLLVGAAVDIAALGEDAPYRELLGREFNLVVAENAMKWDATEPARGMFTFADGDRLVDFAEEHHMKVRGHTLVWDQALPEWVTQGSWSQEELAQILRAHVQGVVSHYRGKVYAWDVVNEAVSDEGGLAQNFWHTNLGPQYIEIAFRAAHEADPDALLFYNDYNAEFMDRKSDEVYALVKDLQARGVPIHGVGLQMHRAVGSISQLNLEANIQRLGKLGLMVHITELDVRLPADFDPGQLDLQAAVYGDVLRACVSQDACQAVLTWGFTDKYSWVPAFFEDEGAALPFDEQYRPKPAYLAWVSVLESP